MLEMENRPGGKIDASEEKGCQKEEALTGEWREKISLRFCKASRTVAFERFFIARYCSARGIVLKTQLQ